MIARPRRSARLSGLSSSSLPRDSPKEDSNLVDEKSNEHQAVERPKTRTRRSWKADKGKLENPDITDDQPNESQLIEPVARVTRRSWKAQEAEKEKAEEAKLSDEKPKELKSIVNHDPLPRVTRSKVIQDPEYKLAQKAEKEIAQRSKVVKDETNEPQPLQRVQKAKRRSSKAQQAEEEKTEIILDPVTDDSDVSEQNKKRKRSPKPELDREIEAEYWKLGYHRIAGVDEAGRGPLAGPVVAAACIIPPHVHIEGIHDSKQLSEAKRALIYDQLMQHKETQCSIEVVDVATIDRINILQATLKAMEGAVIGMPGGNPSFVLVDGLQIPKGLDATKCKAIVKGDEMCLSIAAASILAKVTRDRMMMTYDKDFPEYGFAIHKGYGTKAHVSALKKHGRCDIHRKSFKVKGLPELEAEIPFIMPDTP